MRRTPFSATKTRDDFILASDIHNKQFMLALAVGYISIGAFNTIITLIESIMVPKGLSSDQAGIISAVFIVAGIIGAIVLPIISDNKIAEPDLCLMQSSFTCR